MKTQADAGNLKKQCAPGERKIQIMLYVSYTGVENGRYYV
jgi:hypothetical protein